MNLQSWIFLYLFKANLKSGIHTISSKIEYTTKIKQYPRLSMKPLPLFDDAALAS